MKDRIVIGILLIASIVPFLIGIPPMTDFMNHVGDAFIISKMSDPLYHFSDYFKLSILFRPNVSAHLFLAALMTVLPPLIAGKTYLVLFSLTLYFAAAFYLRALKIEKPHIVALAALPVCFVWEVSMGFLPFLAGLPLHMLLLGLWFRMRHSLLRSVVVAALLVFGFGFHIVGAAIGGFAIGFLALCDFLRHYGLTRAAWKSLFVDLLGVVPVCFCIVYFSSSGAISGLSPRFYSPLHAAAAAITYNFESVARPVFWILIAGFLAYLLTVACLIVKKAARLDLCILSAILGILAIVVPISIGILWPAGPRIFPFAFLTGLGLLRTGDRGRKILITVCSVVIIGASFALTQRTLEIQNDYREYLSGVDKIKYGSKILPVFGNPYLESKYVYPFFTIGDAYNVARGGANPYIFASPYAKTGSASIEFKDYSQFKYDLLYEDDVAPARYEGVSKSYDYVVAFDVTPEIEAAIGNEMPKIFENGRLKIFAASNPSAAN